MHMNDICMTAYKYNSHSSDIAKAIRGDCKIINGDL